MPPNVQKLRKNQNSKSYVRAPLTKTNYKYYADCTALPLSSMSNSLDKRSQSLEGLLDNPSENEILTDSTDNLTYTKDNSAETNKSKNRRSKSLDDLFNDDCVMDDTQLPSIDSQKNRGQQLITVEDSLLKDHEAGEQIMAAEQNLNVFHEVHPKNSFLDKYFKKVKKLIK